MNIQYKLTTDLMHPGVMPRVDVVQGDVYSRSIELSFYQEEFLWKIPENAHISLRYAKPDGTRGIYDTLPDGTAACICHDNVVEFTLAPQMLTVPGPVLAQAVILQGKKQLASFTMQIHVHSDPSAGATTSEDYVNWMDTAIGSQVDRIFQEAKDSGVFNGPAGPAGKTPRIEAARFRENLRTGVKLTVINPGEGNQLDQETRVQLFDGEKGASGVTPNIQRVEVQMLEPGMDAAGEISGTAEDLTLKLAIPKSTPGRDGQTPAFRLASAYILPYGAYPEVTISGPTADLRMQLGIPEGAPGYTPQKDVDYRDGKDYTPKPVFVVSGSYDGVTCWLHQFGTGNPATVEEMVDGFFGGGICKIDSSGESTTLTRQQGIFFISNNAVDYGGLRIYGGTETQYQNALSKYLPGV